MDVDDGTIAEIALIENMQRKDLTVWEEADGLLALCERFGYTHDDVARKVGKSSTTVTEAMSIARIPEDVREICKALTSMRSLLCYRLFANPTTRPCSVLQNRLRRRG